MVLVSLIRGVFSNWVPGRACLVGVKTYLLGMGDGLLEEGSFPKEIRGEYLVLTWFA